MSALGSFKKQMAKQAAKRFAKTEIAARGITLPRSARRDVVDEFVKQILTGLRTGISPGFQHDKMNNRNKGGH